MKRYWHFSLTLSIVAFIFAAASWGQVQAGNDNTHLPVQVQQTILDPTALTWVSSADANTNFGGQGFMWVGYGQGSGAACCSTLRGLARFDLSAIPPGAYVSEARLYVTMWDDQGPPDHFSYIAGAASSAWDEATVTWANKPQASWGPSAVDIQATQGQANWDVTGYVRDWLSGASPNHGFYLFRENDEIDPQEHTRMFGLVQLVVDYEQTAPTDTPIPPPVLEIIKNDVVDPVAPGGEINYVISVQNLGEGTLSGLWLSDTLPPGTSFVNAAYGGAVQEDGDVLWELPELDPGEAFVTNLRVRAQNTLRNGTILTNQAAVF